MVKAEREKKAGNIAYRFMQGVLLGSSGVLPGVSGGVLCVVFGIYKPIMEILSSPVKKLKEYWKMLLPVGIGALVGFVLIVNLLGPQQRKNALQHHISRFLQALFVFFRCFLF